MSAVEIMKPLLWQTHHWLIEHAGEMVVINIRRRLHGLTVAISYNLKNSAFLWGGLLPFWGP